MKLRASQSPVQSDTCQQLHPSGTRVLHHGGRVKESAFLDEPVDAAVVTADGGAVPHVSPTWAVGPSRCSAPPSRSGMGEGRWPGRGGDVGGERGWAGGDFLDLWSCSGKCPRFSSSTVVGYSCHAAETCTHSTNCADDR